MNLETLSPLFWLPLTTGLIFVLVGLFVLKFPPKKINSLYGYRTGSSMSSQEKWDFAQKYSARLMVKWGAVLALTGALEFVFKVTEHQGLVLGFGLLGGFVILIVTLTEKALKKI
jgi:uncharacterized membrane protein